MTSPRSGSAEAETSGTSRHCWLAATPHLKTVSADRARATCCHAGATKSDELPPPPALRPLFQVVSLGALAPSWAKVVPPTPVTSGWSDGSSTASWVRPFGGLAE